jgi:putative FmdB family regulatory protein
MPLYEYKCAKCGDVFELIQKFSDEPLHEHPGCGGAVEKLVSAAALQFKGSGWYVNDYGKNGSGGKEKPKAEKSESDGKKPAEGKQGEKAETSKPAATPGQETSSSTKSTTKSNQD